MAEAEGAAENLRLQAQEHESKVVEGGAGEWCQLENITARGFVLGPVARIKPRRSQ